MKSENLKIFASLAGFNASDIARLANVSRQMASQWLSCQKDHYKVSADKVMRLARGLGVSYESLLEPLCDPTLIETTRHQYLWDNLYPSVSAFVVGVLLREEKALARMAEVYGFEEAEKLVGRDAIDLFPRYKMRIHSTRKKELESIWKNLSQRPA